MKSPQTKICIFMMLMLILSSALVPVLAADETAASGTCGANLTWTLSDDGVLTISGTGAMENYGAAFRTPWYDSNAQIKKVVVESGVTSIGQYAFSEALMEQVQLPDTLTNINTYAFKGCSNLTSVDIPLGVTVLRYAVFSNCSALTHIDLPENLQIIGECAFTACSSLQRVDIPKTVQIIGSSAFQSCTSLEEIVIPEGVTTIGTRTFSRCRSLTSVVLPQTLEKIENRAFEECDSLTHLVIPENVVTMGSNIFFNSELLTGVYFLGDEPRFVGDRIFLGGSENTTVYHLENASGWSEATWCDKPVDVWNYTLSGTATCTQSGTQTFTDESHGVTYTRTINNPCHICEEWTLGRKATSTQEGNWVGTCVVCGQTATKPIPKLVQTEDVPAESYRANRQDYITWSSTVKAYLIENNTGGFTRLEYIPNQVTIEEYDERFVLLSRKALALELEYCAGYYSDGEFHYIAYGQTNPSCMDTQEVLRVVRYTLDWDRIDAASVYGANTAILTDAGSLRMIHYGDMLYVDTCHKMYNGHQASMLVEIYTPKMSVVDTMHTVTYQEYGYVSHSFNQFIALDDGYIVKVDHGDAYPRAVLLTKYTQTADNRIFKTKATIAEVMEFAGSSGNNYTGASIGGFEVTNSHYLIAGNSIVQDGTVSLYNGQRNIFITTTPKDDMTQASTNVVWLTNYADGSNVDVSNPQFVKTGADEYLILWTEDDILNYAFVDSSGQLLGQIRTSEGKLSDCKPILSEDRVIWYVTSNSVPTFYMIDLTQPDIVNSYEAQVPFEIAGANMVLGSVLDMNFFIDKTDLTGTDYYAKITHYAEDGAYTTTIPYAQWEERSDYMVVTLEKLAARQMADAIEVVIYCNDGTVASRTWTDSVRSYAFRIFDAQDDKTKTLLVDMLNYGAAAQTYFDYNCNDLANSWLSDAQQALASQTVVCTNQQVTGPNYYGSTLTLKNRIMLTLYFNKITPEMYAVVSFTDHNGGVHESRIEGSSFAQYSSNIYGVPVDELVVADGNQLVTVTVYDTNDNVVGHACDTVNSYLDRMMGGDALFEAVAKFTNSAYAYFRSLEN